MLTCFRVLGTVVGILFVGNCQGQAQAPKLISVQKIWDQGKHNAFTDLIRWRGKWYCTFREGDGHVGGDGKLRLLESADGKKWSSCALVEEKGIDLRDPHLAITPDDRLMIVAGGSVYQGGKKFLGCQPRVAFSKDGKTWTLPQRVLGEGEWLWRVTWHEGKCYGVSYNAGGRQLGKEPDWRLKLVASVDGEQFATVSILDVPGDPNETTLRFQPNGELLALVRREAGSKLGFIGASKPPYKVWDWQETKHRLGGPNFLRLPDGQLLASTRQYTGSVKTILARMDAKGLEPILTLPSGGDTSYAGMVWHEGQLWLSYYSSHEGKSAIYLAKIEVPLQPIRMGARRELFLDDFLIERVTGPVKRVLHKPQPGAVVLTCDQPWEGNTSAYFTVLQDGDLIRLYYRGSHWDKGKATHREVTCYAESKDGATFTRPNLGLVEFNGSKDNNIIWDGPGAHNFTPFKDANPKADPQARYLALASGRGGLVRFGSPDGIHWKKLGEQPVITRGAFDSQNLAFWDPVLGQYREYHRGFRSGVRGIMTSTSTDFIHWTDPDFLDYNQGHSDHLYTNAIQPYFRAPHILIGFPTRFLPAKQQTEPTFMSSRDGRFFVRFQEPVIPTSAPRERDGNRSNYLAWGMVQAPGQARELSVYATERYYAGPGGRLRRFTYRVDGFASLQAPHQGGEVVTKILEAGGNCLRVNFKAGDQGRVRVAVLDPRSGRPFDGFSLDDCIPLVGDQVDHQVAWKNRGWSDLNMSRVRLIFAMNNADLFSLRFE